MSGKPIHQEFFGPFRFWDPVQLEARPDRRFTLDMMRRESDAPTVVFVPERQYPEGFYLWVSDGRAFFEADRRWLYWYPSADAPGVTHHLRIEARRPAVDFQGWSYFFNGTRWIVGRGDQNLTGED